jgi:kynurenine formamidase
MNAGPQDGELIRMGTVTQAQFRALRQHLSEQVPWGPEDRRGALNYLTAAEVQAAIGEVRFGRHASMACPIENVAAPDNPQPAVHQMTGTAADAAAVGVSFATDRIEMNVHGDKDSHLDALCHVIFDGRLYNNVRADTVVDAGPRELSVSVACDGIVGRGVLLDIPRIRGTSWLEPGDNVTTEDLLAAERAQNVHVGRGDLLFIRLGHQLRRDEEGPWNVAKARAGLHPEVMAMLAERQIAVLGCDSNSDAAASAVEGVDFPVHVLAIQVLGLQLLDYLQFEDLVPLCEASRRWSFLCVIAPLRLPRGTGSPVNPIAIM